MQISELKGIIAKEQRKSQESHALMQALLRDAEGFFNTKVTTSAQLRELFLNTPKSAPPSASAPPGPDPDLIRALQASKAKLKQERKRRVQCERELAARQLEFDSLESSVATLEGELTALQSSAKQHKHTIHEQTAKIDTLESALASHETRPRQPPHIETRIVADPALSRENASLRQRISTLSSQLKDSETANAQLATQFAALQSQSRTFEDSRAKLIEKLKQAKAVQYDTERELALLRDSSASLLADKESLDAQCASLQPQLHASRASFEQARSASDEAQGEIKRLTSAVSLLQSSFETERAQAREAYIQRDRLLTLLHRQDSVLKMHEQMATSVRCDAQRLQQELSVLRGSGPAVSEEIPETSWLCPDFPKELCSRLLELNHSMPTTARVRHVLLTIARFYNERSVEIARRSDAVQQECERRAEATDALLSSLSAMLNIPLTVGGDLTAVARLRDENAAVLTRRCQLEEDLRVILAAAGAHSAGEAEEAIGRIERENESLRIELVGYVAYAKRCRKQAKHAALRANAEAAQRDNEARAHAIEAERAAEAHKQLEVALEQAMSQAGELHAQLRAAEEALQEAQAAAEREGRELAEKLASERANAEAHVAAVEAERAAHAQEVDRAHREVAQWKRRSDLIASETREKEAQLALAKRDNEEAAREFAKKLTDERAAAKAQAEKMIEAFRLKNKELSELTQNTANDLMLADEKNRQLAAANVELAMERDQLLAKIGSVSEEQERQRQLLTTKLRAVELAAETRAHNQIEDTKAFFEQQRRNIYADVAVTFQRFYDGKRELDEQEFQAILTRTQGELARLVGQEMRVRRLLGLDVGESPEEAIAELLRVRPFVGDRSHD
jgi:predicted  nucleic acid-binding Zn-ribbon protein